MKKMSCLCLMLALTAKVFCQSDTALPKQSVQADYLKKSKTQKTIAWVMLGAGTAMIAGGLIVGANSLGDDPNFDDAVGGSVLIATGLIIDVASIPFFIMGAKNKQRAMSVSMRNDLVPQLQKGSLVRVPLPTVSLVLRF